MEPDAICYIVGAGEPSVLPPRQGAFVIAADGGYAHLAARGIPADLVIGDFDSLGAPPPHPNVKRLPPEKDDTDMLAALRAGLSMGYRLFRICGGMGGQIEHTLANIQCLAFLAERGARGELLGADRTLTVLKAGCLWFDETHRGYVSVFAYGGSAEGVTLLGLKYPLDGATLTGDFPLGVHNEFLGVPASIAVRCGALLIVYPFAPRGGESTNYDFANHNSES